MPSSFASSCTRALPATALLKLGGRRRVPLDLEPSVEARSWCDLHDWLMTGRPGFHGWRVRGAPGPQVVLVTRCCSYLDVLLQVGPYPIGVERARGAERPRERRATLGTGKALRDGMQPCTTPGEPPPRVRDDSPVHRDDPQQVVGHCPGAAPDTGPDWPSIGSRLIEEAFLPCGIAARASDRIQAVSYTHLTLPTN